MLLSELRTSLLILQNVIIILGVTWCNPADITRLPGHPWGLPQSCLMLGGCLYKNGVSVGSCPRLYVSPGDDVSIKHANKHLQFFKNKQLIYTWDIEILAPVWADIGLFYVNKISIKEYAIGELS